MMDSEWTMHRGDPRGETRQMQLAAALATLVSPEQTALKLERAMELRSDTARVVYLLAPTLTISGELVRTSTLRDALAEGRITAQDTHPAADALSGIQHWLAIRDWQRSGTHYTAAACTSPQRCTVLPGSPGPVANVVTVATHSRAKAAACARLGMGLYSILGSGDACQYIIHRYSSSMVDAEGAAVRYDAAQLIMAELHDQLPLSHPWILAYRACTTFEQLLSAVGESEPSLIVTPDVARRGARYDAHGQHALIHPNAPGHVWDDVEAAFFG